MKISRHFIYIIGFFLFGCSPTYTLQLHEEKVIGIQAERDSNIIAIIAPYKNRIETQMKEVLTYTKNNLPTLNLCLCLVNLKIFSLLLNNFFLLQISCQFLCPYYNNGITI